MKRLYFFMVVFLLLPITLLIASENPIDPLPPGQPSVTTDSATSIDQTDVILNATINPNFESTTYWFELGTTSLTYTDTSLQQVLIPGSLPVPVNYHFIGLNPNTTYYYHGVAENGSNLVYGNELVFTTLPTLPNVLTNLPTFIRQTSARLNGNISSSNGGTIRGWFKWDISPSVNNHTSWKIRGSGISTVDLSDVITGLNPQTTYYYQAEAADTSGLGSGSILSFTTLASTKEYQPDAATVGLWHFNESLGIYAEDYSGGGHHGSANGTVIVPGKFGRARGLNTITDYVEITSEGGAFNFSASDFTLEAWVQPFLEGGGNVIVIAKGNPDTGTAPYALRILSSRQIELVLNSTGSLAGQYIVQTDSPLVADLVWQHIAVTVNQQTAEVTFFYNGVPVPATITTGTFPVTLFTTTSALRIGNSSTSMGKSTTTSNCNIDEVRISKVVRNPVEFNVFSGTIAGVKFNDLNKNGIMDPTDTGIPNWHFYLINKTMSGLAYFDSVVTDSDGDFAFMNVPDGEYGVFEEKNDNWITTIPRGRGFYYVNIIGGSNATGLLFGGIFGHRFMNSAGGYWSNPSNWDGNNVPGPDDPVIIRDGITVTVDYLPNDSIYAMRILRNSHLVFAPLSNGTKMSGGLSLKIHHSVMIDSGGTLEFPSSADTNRLDCFGDWINRGNFIPGTSTIRFFGTEPKSIVYEPVLKDINNGKSYATNLLNNSNAFFNLAIMGDNVSSSGNISIINRLILNNHLIQQQDDTLFIANDDTAAITSGGKIENGTIRRAISLVPDLRYRFSDPQSFVQFNSLAPAWAGVFSLETPTVSITTISDSMPVAPTKFVKWGVVGGMADTVQRTIRVDSVTHFSKWTYGTPSSGLRKSNDESGYGAPMVDRFHIIKADGISNYQATLQLSYEGANVYTGPGDLRLESGPVGVDTVRKGWNMISLLLTPENPHKNLLFPGASSNAFEYSPLSGYKPADSLKPGTGYWLKFPAPTEVSYIGDERYSDTIDLLPGWNMIGTLSFTVSTSSAIFEPPGISTGIFFGYGNGYFTSDSLLPFHAYWIKSNQVGKLYLSARNSSPLGRTGEQKTLSSLCNIIFSEASGGAQTLYFGGQEGIFRDCTMPPRPPKGIFDARFSMDTFVDVFNKEGSREIPISISSSEYPLTITWDLKTGVSSAYLIVDGNATQLTKNGRFKILSEPSTISLRYTRDAFSGDLPKEFALYQNYPNPFNPTTTIKFDLPFDANVTLKVFNLLGQEITTLINNSFFKAGRYNEEFSFKGLASGIYFYRISMEAVGATTSDVTHFKSIKKMLLLK